VDFPSPAAVRGVIDRQVQIGVVGDEVGQDQIEHCQAELVDRPAGGREEPMRPVMRAGRGRPGPAEHPAHRTVAGLREQAEDHRVEHLQRRRRETPDEGVHQPAQRDRQADAWKHRRITFGNDSGKRTVDASVI
jgi:hypothetical protein